MADCINFTRKRKILRNILLDEFEIFIFKKMSNVFFPAGEQIIKTEDIIPFS